MINTAVYLHFNEALISLYRTLDDVKLSEKVKTKLKSKLYTIKPGICTSSLCYNIN